MNLRFLIAGAFVLAGLGGSSLGETAALLRDRQFRIGRSVPKTGRTINQCEVWQAEEVREGKRWQRFYGIVSQHRLSRVPAEELKFSGYPPP